MVLTLETTGGRRFDQATPLASFARVDDGMIDVLSVRTSATVKADYLKAIRAADEKVRSGAEGTVRRVGSR